MAMGRAEGGSGRPDGDVGGAAALAGTRLLRPAAGTAAGGRVRRVRGRGVQALLRAEDGGAVAAAGAVFPHAHDRLFRGDRQRARHRVALRGLVLAARFSAAVECNSNIQMTPLCKVEVTLPRFLGSWGVRYGGGVDEQAGVQPA